MQPTSESKADETLEELENRAYEHSKAQLPPPTLEDLEQQGYKKIVARNYKQSLEELEEQAYERLRARQTSLSSTSSDDSEPAQQPSKKRKSHFKTSAEEAKRALYHAENSGEESDESIAENVSFWDTFFIKTSLFSKKLLTFNGTYFLYKNI